MQARSALVSRPASRAGAARASRRAAVAARAAACEGAVLRSIQEARVREAVGAYAKEAAAWTQVKFTLRRRASLGDTWKVVGPAPELGRWAPDVATRMTWSDGDVWTAVVRLPPGEHEFKAALRAADGTITWEAGPDRAVVVPQGAAEVAVELDVRLPGEEPAPAEPAAPATPAAAPAPAAAAAAAAPAPAPVVEAPAAAAAPAPAKAAPAPAKAAPAPAPVPATAAAAAEAPAAPAKAPSAPAKPAPPGRQASGSTTVETERGRIVIEETTYVRS